MDPHQGQFMAAVPAGAKGGDSVLVTAPNGVQAQVQVPAGLAPGMQFAVAMPAAYGHGGQVVVAPVAQITTTTMTTRSVGEQFPQARDVNAGSAMCYPLKGLTYLWCNCAVLGKVVAIMLLVAAALSLICLVGGVALFFSVRTVCLERLPTWAESFNASSIPFDIPVEFLPTDPGAITRYATVAAASITLAAVLGYLLIATLLLDGIFKSEIIFQTKKHERIFELMGVKPTRDSCCTHLFRRIMWHFLFVFMLVIANVLHAIPIVGTVAYYYFICLVVGWWYHDDLFLEAFGTCDFCLQGTLVRRSSPGGLGVKYVRSVASAASAVDSSLVCSPSTPPSPPCGAHNRNHAPAGTPLSVSASSSSTYALGGSSRLRTSAFKSGRGSGLVTSC